MRFLKFLAVTLVVALGFSSCKPDNGDDHDHTSDLAGTWTCLTENYAEALIINADGSAVSYGVEDGEYWENVAGNIVVENGTITMTFEDGDNFEGHFDIIPGMAFSIHNENGDCMTYNYCKEDLSEEIIGMWVCNDAPAGADNDMAIISYEEDGSTSFTGILPNQDGYTLNVNTTYNVVGDLMFKKNAVQGTSNSSEYISTRLTYVPNGTVVGDIMVYKHYNGIVETSSSYLRIKQNLDLPGMKYDYMKTFISNVNGKDMDVPFFNTTINFANFDSSIFDMFLKNTLFSVQFPNANTIEYSFLLGEQITPMQAPIVVEGNKMTIKMSEVNSVCRDVEVYTFQDQDNTQMHMYMHTSTFVNFFGNMQINLMAAQGQLDMNDAAAVNAVYDSIDEAVESINFSLVMTKAN